MGKTTGANNLAPGPQRFDPSWQQVETAIDWQTRKLLMVIGLPGSGKSTWAQLMSERHGCTVVSADQIRIELFATLQEANQLGKQAHQRVFREAHNRMRTALRAGQVVIADATHLYEHARQPLITLAAEENVPLQIILFDNDQQAIVRNSARPEATRVPDDAMQRMQKAARDLREELPENFYILR